MTGARAPRQRFIAHPSKQPVEDVLQVIRKARQERDKVFDDEQARSQQMLKASRVQLAVHVRYSFAFPSPNPRGLDSLRE